MTTSYFNSGSTHRRYLGDAASALLLALFLFGVLSSCNNKTPELPKNPGAKIIKFKMGAIEVDETKKPQGQIGGDPTKNGETPESPISMTLILPIATRSATSEVPKAAATDTADGFYLSPASQGATIDTHPTAAAGDNITFTHGTPQKIVVTPQDGKTSGKRYYEVNVSVAKSTASTLTSMRIAGKNYPIQPSEAGGSDEATAIKVPIKVPPSVTTLTLPIAAPANDADGFYRSSGATVAEKNPTAGATQITFQKNQEKVIIVTAAAGGENKTYYKVTISDLSTASALTAIKIAGTNQVVTAPASGATNDGSNEKKAIVVPTITVSAGTSLALPVAAPATGANGFHRSPGATVAEKNPTAGATQITFTSGVQKVIIVTAEAGGAHQTYYKVTVSEEDITAGFAYAVTPASSGNITVTFFNTAVNATTYSWNFGESSSSSNTSTAKNPSHDYASPGTYTVGLTATKGTKSKSISQGITLAYVSNEVLAMAKALVGTWKLDPNAPASGTIGKAGSAFEIGVSHTGAPCAATAFPSTAQTWNGWNGAEWSNTYSSGDPYGYSSFWTNLYASAKTNAVRNDFYQNEFTFKADGTYSVDLKGDLALPDFIVTNEKKYSTSDSWTQADIVGAAGDLSAWKNVNVNPSHTYEVTSSAAFSGKGLLDIKGKGAFLGVYFVGVVGANSQKQPKDSYKYYISSVTANKLIVFSFGGSTTCASDLWVLKFKKVTP